VTLLSQDYNLVIRGRLQKGYDSFYSETSIRHEEPIEVKEQIGNPFIQGDETSVIIFWNMELNRPINETGVKIIMNEKELALWKDYQEKKRPAIQAMSNVELDEFIHELEGIIFEGKATHQTAYQEKKEREIKERGGILPVLQTGNASTPLDRLKKDEKKKTSKKERINDGLSLLGLDSGDTMAEFKKFTFDKQLKEMQDKAAVKTAIENEKKTAAHEARPIINGADCGFSPTGKHEIRESVCAWCGERES
jgi:hypothetical protein